MIRLITSNTLGRTGERDSLVVWSPPSRNLGGVQPDLGFGSSPFLGSPGYGITPCYGSDKNPTLHLLCERQSSPVIAALLMQLLCITLGQTMDAEKPNETMNKKKGEKKKKGKKAIKL